jgi:hypothetical protein
LARSHKGAFAWPYLSKEDALAKREEGETRGRGMEPIPASKSYRFFWIIFLSNLLGLLRIIFLLLILDCNKSLLWSLVSDKDKQKEVLPFSLSFSCNSVPFAWEEKQGTLTNT